MIIKNVISDHVLVEQYVNGNEKALAILINRHQRAVLNFIFSKVQNRELAEDLFHDTFIKVVDNLKLNKYQETGKFLPWVMRIAHNLVIDYYRRNARFKKIDLGDNEDFRQNFFSLLGESESSFEDLLIREQILKDLSELIAYLPKDQKEIIELRFYKNLSFKEISEDTGVSVNTALGRMRYALINMRKIIAEKNIILSE